MQTLNQNSKYYGKYNVLPKLTPYIVDKDFCQQLVDSGIHKNLAPLYVARGITDIKQLNQRFEGLAHPHTLLGNQEAGNLLAQAIINHKTIVVVADYDCDGATSCALAILGLQLLSFGQVKIYYVVPNRFTHGYGLTPEIVDLCKVYQPDLLMTVDNGISSIEGVAYAKQLGWQVVITDHHLTSKELPAADAIVNPNQANCTFISKNIAGVGVLFYVLLATRIALRELGFFEQNAHRQPPKLEQLLDLVALGTVADVVKLDFINRLLVHKGLQIMHQGKAQIGIKALMAVANCVPEQITSQDLGFMLGPRLNAAGRLDDMRTGIECLISQNTEHAAQLALTLHEMNQMRKSIEQTMQQDVTELNLDQLLSQQQTHSVVLYQADWHQGVIGILASRVKDYYYRPTLIFANNSEEEDGLIKASGRSIAGFHMRDAIDLISKQHPHIITKFGGHAMAAGLTIKKAYYEEFSQAFEKIAQNWLNSQALQTTWYLDELPASAHTLEFVNLLNQQVWGQGFDAPLFAKKAYIHSIQILKDAHTKLVVSLLDNEQSQFGFSQKHAAIFFNTVLPEELLNQTVDLVYQLNANTWQQKQTLQLMVRLVSVNQ